jgi:hypothetical protein
MKKIALLTLLVVGFAAIATSVSAQKQQQVQSRNAVGYHHELALGYGRISSVEIATDYVNFLSVFVGNRTPFIHNNTGSIALAYKYRFNKVASLGATYVFEGFDVDMSQAGEVKSKGRITYHTVAMECDFRYLTRPAVTLYSTLGVATSIGTFESNEVGSDVITRKSSVTPIFHVSLLGIKVGSQRAGGLVELGIGYKGLVNVGGYVRF